MIKFLIAAFYYEYHKIMVPQSYFVLQKCHYAKLILTEASKLIRVYTELIIYIFSIWYQIDEIYAERKKENIDYGYHYYYV